MSANRVVVDSDDEDDSPKPVPHQSSAAPLPVKSEASAPAPATTATPPAPAQDDSDSDSDDDIPLSQLTTSKSLSSNASSKAGSAAPAAARPAAAASSSDDSDSDDNVPLSQLVGKKPPSSSTSGGGKTALSRKKSESSRLQQSSRSRDGSRARRSRGSSPRRSGSAEPSRKRARTSSSNGGGSAVAKAASTTKRRADVMFSVNGARLLDKAFPLKLQAVESILVRWQYTGIEWPPHDMDLTPPKGFDPLPGLPGVFVGVEMSVLGEIVDRRPSAPRPSQRFLLSLPSSELATMWKNALHRQRQVLEEHEGKNHPLLQGLKEEMKSQEVFERFADKWEEQATKYLARHGGTPGAPSLESLRPSSSGPKAMGAVKSEPKKQPPSTVKTES